MFYQQPHGQSTGRASCRPTDDAGLDCQQCAQQGRNWRWERHDDVITTQDEGRVAQIVSKWDDTIFDGGLSDIYGGILFYDTPESIAWEQWEASRSSTSNLFAGLFRQRFPFPSVYTTARRALYAALSGSTTSPAVFFLAAARI